MSWLRIFINFCTIHNSGIQKTVVGGFSLGSYLTLHFCNQHPDITVAIILIGTGLGYRIPEKAKCWNQRDMDRAKVLETQWIKGFMESEYSGDDCDTIPEVMIKRNFKGLANISRGVMINP